MKILLIILIIFLIILFFPLRLKFTILYCEDNYYIKFYKFKIVSKEKPIKNEEKPISEDKKAKLDKKKDTNFFANLAKSISPTILVKYIDSNIYKPKLKLHGKLAYSLGDAAKTAISYGTISALLPFLYRFISIIFKVKKMDFPINPQFEDKFLLNIDITSIIYLSFAQIIYVIFLILKSVAYSKEANLKRANL